jgi:hypothetical protein
MIELFAALVLALFALFWLAVQLVGWLIIIGFVLLPIAWVVSKFIVPPR